MPEGVSISYNISSSIGSMTNDELFVLEILGEGGGLDADIIPGRMTPSPVAQELSIRSLMVP